MTNTDSGCRVCQVRNRIDEWASTKLVAYTATSVRTGRVTTLEIGDEVPQIMGIQRLAVKVSGRADAFFSLGSPGESGPLRYGLTGTPRHVLLRIRDTVDDLVWRGVYRLGLPARPVRPWESIPPAPTDIWVGIETAIKHLAAAIDLCGPSTSVEVVNFVVDAGEELKRIRQQLAPSPGVDSGIYGD